ncbi:MAG: polar amino acid transport system substrate-binding protein [Desulforhopalus sp.]
MDTARKNNQKFIPSITLLCLFLVTQFLFLQFTTNFVEANNVKRKDTFYMAINRPEGTPLFEWTKLIYTEVFRRLNMELLVEYYPLKRASVQANKGEVDGEPARVYGYAESYPSLVRVEESIFSMNVVAYTIDPSLAELRGWSSLENSEYTVEYPYGMEICEINLSKVLATHQILSIKQSLQGLERLVAGRTDLYIDDLNSTTPIIEDLKNGFKNIVRIAGGMESTPLYMYIHNSHRELKEKLETIIRDIKEEGLVELYRKEAFNLQSDLQ